MPPTRELRSEERLRDLASLIVECRALSSKLDLLAEGPGRESAPFLYRQLAQVLGGLERSVRAAGAVADEPGAGEQARTGLFGRLRRGRKASGGKEPRREGAGLQGNSWTVAIPELIGMLSNTRKSGVLWVHAPGETFLLQFSNGKLLHATSDGAPAGERLGELLVLRGALSEHELGEFLETHQDGILGVALCREGKVSEDELFAALAEQIQRLFHRMLAARDSVFRFQEGLELLVQHHVSLNVMQLLLETAKTFDEKARAQAEAAGGAPDPLAALDGPEATELPEGGEDEPAAESPAAEPPAADVEAQEEEPDAAPEPEREPEPARKRA